MHTRRRLSVASSVATLNPSLVVDFTGHQPQMVRSGRMAPKAGIPGHNPGDAWKYLRGLRDRADLRQKLSVNLQGLVSFP
jgi:hypothetical protein